MAFEGGPVDLVILGAGGHAEVLRDAAERSNDYRVVAFVVTVDHLEKTLGGLPVLSGATGLSDARAFAAVIHVAIGNPNIRKLATGAAKAAGFSIATVVHPAAVVASSVMLGEGCGVLANAVINAGAELGQGCIVNSGAIVEHHCQLGDWVHIAPAARMGGHTKIGAETWVGIGATLRDTVTIGARSFIGAGAVVVSDLPDDIQAVGVPARPKSRVV